MGLKYRMDPNAIEIRRVDLERIIPLRYEILRAGLPRQMAYFPGDDAPQTVHIAAVQNGKVIGCATIMLNSYQGEPAYQLRGMAVDPAHQKSGLGRKLLSEADRIAAENNIRLFWANCRTPAVGFYKKLGWIAVSEEFEIPTAGPHFRMVRRL